MTKESALWGDAKQSDDLALKDFFALHYKPLCVYALQFTKNMPDAEDIVQNVFVKLWERREEIVIKTSVKAYLYRTVYNSYLDTFRNGKKKNAFLDTLRNEALSYQMDNDDTDTQKIIDHVKVLVNELPKGCKEILLLSKWEGYKHKEIAEKLNISVKTVESQLRIAFRKIREGFENDDSFFFFVLAKVLQRT